LLLEIMLVGTTVKGAVDDLDLVIQILKEVGYTEDRFYIHIDGALFGLMIPFVKRVSIHPFFFLSDMCMMTMNLPHALI